MTMNTAASTSELFKTLNAITTSTTYDEHEQRKAFGAYCGLQAHANDFAPSHHTSTAYNDDTRLAMPALHHNGHTPPYATPTFNSSAYHTTPPTHHNMHNEPVANTGMLLLMARLFMFVYR